MIIKPGDFFAIRFKRYHSFRVYIADDKDVWFWDDVIQDWHKMGVLRLGNKIDRKLVWALYKY
jgi:hypothetical protein